MRSLIALGLALVLLNACGSSTPSPSPTEPAPPAVVNPCLVTVLGVPEGIFMSETDPIPPGSQVVAAPVDFDPGGTVVDTNDMGNARLTLRLRGDAVERFATYT